MKQQSLVGSQTPEKSIREQLVAEAVKVAHTMSDFVPWTWAKDKLPADLQPVWIRSSGFFIEAGVYDAEKKNFISREHITQGFLNPEWCPIGNTGEAFA